MKAVILAAGQSTRTHPLTLETPKVLLKVAGKSLLEHNLESLKGLVDEAILVVGFKRGMIEQALGKEYQGIKLTYAHQSEQLGTGHAMLTAEPHLDKEGFIVLAGDDLYSRENLKNLINDSPSLLAYEVEDPSAFGIWLENDGFVSGFQEKPERPESNLANCSLYVLGPEIFPHLRKLEKTVRGEYELNEAVNSLSKEKPIRIVKSKEGWVPVGYPWRFLDANKIMLNKMEPRIEGEVEEGATIRGRVYIGEGTRVLAGSYIEGPVMIGRNCVIGPQAYIRPDTYIEDNCRIGRAEVVDSIIMEGTTAKHHSYMGHSVIGRNCNIAAGTVTADYRHDGKENWTLIKGAKVNTGRRKLGAFIGDCVMTGINTTIYPGRKIWPGKTTLPGQVVDKDIE
jgi:bifunctional UDP-N-acetylglucosamine pyrophosphorylase/glucosamine-1-phosphate N-acetyltransferase